MAALKRTIVRVEKNRLSIIRPAHAAVSLWCEQCTAVVPMVTPERAAQLCGAPPRAIYRLVENDQVHFVEAEAGELFICVVSLSAKQF